MNIVLFLATQKGCECLKKIIEAKKIKQIGLVVSFREQNMSKDYFEEIMTICKMHNILFKDWKEIKNSLLEQCSILNIQVGFAVGWKYMISTKFNEQVKYGLIVFHDSLLPKYRGFAPTPTAIICGEVEVGVTALKACDEVDAGDVVLQKKIQIDSSDYIQDVIDKESEIYAQMLIEIIESIENGTIQYTKQNHEEATYSIWRDEEDYKIDWYNTSKEVSNSVRALSYPYKGAYTFYNNRKIVIDKVLECEDLVFAIRQPGKIWKIENGHPIVICGTGMLKILKAHDEVGEEVIFNKLRTRLGRKFDFD